MNRIKTDIAGLDQVWLPLMKAWRSCCEALPLSAGAWMHRSTGGFCRSSIVLRWNLMWTGWFIR